MGGEIGVEPVVYLQHEHVLPVHIDALGVVEVVGEEFKFRAEVDVLGQRILELGHGTGTKLVTDFVDGMLNSVIGIQGIDTKSPNLGKMVVIDDGHTAGDG